MEENETQNHTQPGLAQPDTPRDDNRNRRGRRDDYRQRRPDKHQPAPADAPQPPQEPDEDAATAEEMEAFLRERREKNKVKKEHTTEGDPQEPETLREGENSIDPYLEPDPSIPPVPYKESPFLARGCNRCPECYNPVSRTEQASCCKLSVCNWMSGIRPSLEKPFDCVEVRFKNNRKDFFRLPDGIGVTEGDLVAVEGAPGHDIGIVSLCGELCRIQMKKKHVDPASESIRRLYRRAKVPDIEKWAEGIREEDAALRRTRQISESMGLVMKVNDVEFQGDHSKAIFYYTADERVDFRNLIKVLAEEFHVRIEMKQIGVRQEAGKVGGLGTCGRELCCSTWLTNFKSVTTSVAKAQQILPNPQKLAGQCGKLKCCLNFEYEVYVDALKKFPPLHVAIRFQKGLALYKKIDVFRGVMWYAYEGENDLYAIPAESVKQIIEMNNRQEYPEKLEDFQVELMSSSALEQEASEHEFEQQLNQLADKGNEVVRDENRNERQPNRRPGDRNRNPRSDNKEGRPERRPNRNEQGEHPPNNDESRNGRDGFRRQPRPSDERHPNRNQRNGAPNPERRSGNRERRPGNRERRPTPDNINNTPQA